jgi:predicted PurR-regulated permease PerM
MEKNRLEIASFSILCAIILVLTFFVFQPFLSILILAAVLSLLFKPLYNETLKFYSKGKNLAAVVVVFTALIFIILPILFFGFQIIGQVQKFFTLIESGSGPHISAIQQSVEALVRNLFPNFSFNISEYASKVLIFISSNFGTFISQTAYIFFQTFLLLFTLFFFLRDGDYIFNGLISLSPFKKEQNVEIVKSIHGAITSVVRGTLFVGLIRWGLLTAGFYLLGIPDAMVWGSVAGIIGMTPGLGTPFVIIPTVIYFFLVGSMMSVIGTILFGVLIMIFIDNILSSYFFGKGLDAPPVFILFSILGGVMFFGPLGFIFGPIVLSLCISIIEMYKILILNPRK